MSQIREANLQLLRQAGFVVADNLPVSRTDDDESPILRPKGDIFGRLVALKAWWLWVDGSPQAETETTVREMLHADDVHRFLTPTEASDLELSRDKAVEKHWDVMGWKNKNCWPLAWALGFPDAPSVTARQVAGDFGRRLMLHWLPNNARDSRSLRESCILRDARDVHNLEDLFYCAHNAVRSAQIGADTVPDDLDPVVDGGCIHERRHALTWALSPGIDWTDADLST